MQVRIDYPNAREIRKNTDAYYRMFKRRKSFSQYVNECLRDLHYKRPQVKLP